VFLEAVARLSRADRDLILLLAWADLAARHPGARAVSALYDQVEDRVLRGG
jgi:hypothetical protein